MKKNYNYGKSIAFYYVSEEHLVLNLYYYIKKAIEQNEKVLLCVENHTYDKLMDIINGKMDNAFIIEKFSFEEYVYKLTPDLYNTFDVELINCCNNIKQAGYNGIKIIEQASLVLKTISNKQYIEGVKKISKLPQNINCSLLSLYNFEDYINGQEYIDKEIMRASKEEQNFVLTNFEIIETD